MVPLSCSVAHVDMVAPSVARWLRFFCRARLARCRPAVANPALLRVSHRVGRRCPPGMGESSDTAERFRNGTRSRQDGRTAHPRFCPTRVHRARHADEPVRTGLGTQGPARSASPGVGADVPLPPGVTLLGARGVVAFVKAQAARPRQSLTVCARPVLAERRSPVRCSGSRLVASANGGARGRSEPIEASAGSRAAVPRLCDSPWSRRQTIGEVRPRDMWKPGSRLSTTAATERASAASSGSMRS